MWTSRPSLSWTSGAVIVKLAFRVLAEPEHARQRREADGFDRLPVFVHGERRCWSRGNTTPPSMSRVVVSPGRMRNSYAPAQLTLSRIAKSRSSLSSLLRLAQPPVGEDGKFLRAVAFAAVQRQAARGFAVALVFAEQPEIARAEKRAEFVQLVRLVQRIQHAEARVAGVDRNLVRDVRRLP